MTAEKKKPGRPKNGPLVKVGPDVVDKTPQDMIDSEGHANSLLIQHEQNLAIIDRTYGENLPYDRTRVENEVRFFIQTTKISMLEVGRRLVLLKEHEGKGKFLESLERIDIAPRSAQAMMKAFLKFGSGKTASLANLGTAKMFELLGESDEDLALLADGGTLAGYKKDAMENMSSRELRAALNKEKERRAEEEEASQMLLQKKDEMINRLDRDLEERRQRVKKWDGVMAELGANITRFSAVANEQIHHLGIQIEEILGEAERLNATDEEVTVAAEAMCNAINSVQAHLDGLAAQFNNQISGYMPVHEIPIYAPDYNSDHLTNPVED